MRAILRISMMAGLLLCAMPVVLRAQDQAAPTPTAASQKIAIFTATADQQPTDAQLARLFEVMRVHDQLVLLTKNMPAMIQQQSQEQMEQLYQEHPEIAQLSAEQKQAYNKVMGRFWERMLTVCTGDDILADMKDVYRRHLTCEDTDALIALYSAPAGQHMLGLATAVMQEMVPALTHRMQERMKPIVADLEKDLDSITKSPAGLQPVYKAPGVKK